MRSASVAVAATALLIGLQTPPAPAGASGTSRPSTGDAGALRDRAVDLRPLTEDWSAEFGPSTGEHVGLTAAAAWHTAGFDGGGVKVGVIDFFDVPIYWNVEETGPTPVANVTARCIARGADCSDEMFDGVDAGGEDHGVAVVELIKDMAPAAEILIGTAETVDDYRQLVDWFADNGVTVINRSLGTRYDGPGDGRGQMSDVAAYANLRGITWVNSGGNNAVGRYYRQPVRLFGDNVAFGATGTELFLRFNDCALLAGVRWANDWDLPPEQRTDYDLLLWDAPFGDPTAGTLVASSGLDQRAGASPLEFLDDPVEPGQPICPSDGEFARALYLEIKWRGGEIAGDVIEILDYAAGFSNHTQREYSASTPIVDSDRPGVLAVASIDPAGSGQVGPYSSRGPTNDGRIAPDVAATSGITSSVLGTTFSGTSASAAVVTGGVALLLDAALASDPGSVGSLVRHLAVDRGAPGPDNEFGAGEFVLPAPPEPVANTPSRFVPLDAPQRVLDTRPGSAIGPANLIGELQPGDIIDLPLTGRAGVPSDGVTAVAVNITAVEFGGPTFVQALPTLAAPVGAYSNLNLDGPGQTRANLAIVPVGAGGAISLSTIGRGHLVVDLLGYFVDEPESASGGRLVPLARAERLLDTRQTSALTSLETRAVPWPTRVDRSLAEALVVTVTGTRAGQPGWLQAHPSDRPDVIGTTSTVNVPAAGSVANTAIVPVGADGIAITGFFGDSTGDVVVDVIGYITSELAPTSTTGRFVPLTPSRALDSRVGPPLTTDSPVTIDPAGVPDDATALIWNLVAVDVGLPGFGRAWAADQPRPETSAFNWGAGEVRAAAAITAAPGGRASIALHDADSRPDAAVGHVIADVFGYFT